jgi:hypothetical protein
MFAGSAHPETNVFGFSSSVAVNCGGRARYQPSAKDSKKKVLADR